MTTHTRNLLFVLALVLINLKSYSQFGLAHEIGAYVGGVAFQSDFGERSDFETNSGNTGIALGIVHYLDFSYKPDCNCYRTPNFFTDHFKLRSELAWNRTQLNHFGEWVDEARTSGAAERLRRHSGTAQTLNLGMQLEYYPRSLRAFGNGVYRFAPFAALGAQYVFYNPDVETTFGDQNINNLSNFYQPWLAASNGESFIDDGKGTTWSVVASVGTRYKLNTLSDLFIEMRWQHYFSDFVDGLNHNLSSNKNNDWNYIINIGYIYYLN